MEAAKKKVVEYEKMETELNRKLELLDKNLNAESKNLRTKLHAVEAENEEYKKKYATLEEQFKVGNFWLSNSFK